MLSGDRFVDFSGHKALAMVIAPLIFARQVQITELNVNVDYETEGHEHAGTASIAVGGAA